MRSLKVALVITLTALAGACASPLDEPIGRDTASVRVSEEQVATLPGCDTVASGAISSGAAVLPTVFEDLFAISVAGALVCVDDVTGVTGMGLALPGVDEERQADEPPPVEGTPLPARTANPPPEGTPLPARH